MSFSLKTNEFQNVISRIRSVSSQAMEKSDSDLKHWAQKIILVNFVFNAESIDQLEQNLPETRKWDLFNLVECYKHCKDDELELLKVASIIIFIYLQEAYFRLGVDKEDPAFNRFKDAIYDLKMNEYQTYKTYFDYLDELPYRITKDIYSNSKLNEIRKFLEEKDFSDFNKLIISTEETLKKIEKWEESFDQKQKAVQDLEERLEQNKLTYDFVLLSKGFQQLYDQKKLELKERRDGYSMFGALLVCTPLAVIVAIVIMILSGYEAKLSSLWFLALPITTLILFLFYFTRVGLQHVRSIQSQMMQLELRMALCQFIHNYAEDSEKLHKKNQAGFEKFENIIFSPLVSSDDKIPTTFDGMEQLAKLIGEFRKN